MGDLARFTRNSVKFTSIHPKPAQKRGACRSMSSGPDAITGARTRARVAFAVSWVCVTDSRGAGNREMRAREGRERERVRGLKGAGMPVTARRQGSERVQHEDASLFTTKGEGSATLLAFRAEHAQPEPQGVHAEAATAPALHAQAAVRWWREKPR